MADDNNDPSRLTITVPAPKARINLGKPLGGDEPFGYTGMTLQSDVHLFVDVNKYSFFQAGAAYWQSGAQWTQFAATDMVLSTGGTNMLTSDGKVTIAAGAGQGGISALDHAQQHVAPAFEPFNNLDLHYRIEEAHNGIRKLFYGDDWSKHQGTLQDAQLTANGVAAGVRMNVPAPAYPADGLLGKLWTTLDGLGYDPKDGMGLLEPLEWKGNFKEMQNGWPGSADSSVYPQFQAFDPYPATQFSSTSTVGTVYAQFAQTVNFFHRFCDLLAKVAPFITESFVGKRVTSLINIWGNAQDAANAALNVADIARWDREGDQSTRSGGAFGDEAANFKARLGPTKDLSGTAATMASGTEPFDYSGLAAGDLYFDVWDLEGGASQRVWLTATAAKLPLAPPVLYKQLTLTATDPTQAATVTAGGAAATYTPGSPGTWAAPAGFTVTGSTLSSSDGALFTADATTNAAIAETTTDSVTVAVDGTNYTVSLATVTGATAALRATALAAAVNAQKAGAAAASGASVTLTGTVTGTSGTLQLSGSSDALTRAGVTTTAQAAGSGLGSAADVAAALAGKGNFSAAASGGVVTITHNVTGHTSYIQVSGPLASRIWGGDPSVARGTDNDALTNFDTMRSVEWEMAKWPEDTKNLFRPVVQAFRDVMEVYDHIKNIVDETMKIAGALPDPPKMLGFFAAEGVTLGTAGPVFGIGQSITLVAAPKGEPDARKFALGPVEKLLTEGPEWLPMIKDMLTPGWFKVPDKPTHDRKGTDCGGFRVVSAKGIALMSQEETRIVAVKEASVEGDTVKIASKSGTTIAARDADLTLVGKTMTLGALAAAGKQAATASMKLFATQYSLETAALVATFNTSKIDLGAVTAHAIDRSKPRLYVDTGTAVEMGVGDNNGAVVQGVSVASGGAVTVKSNGLLKLTGNGAAVELNTDVSVTGGNFKVGASFSVTSAGGAVTMPPIPTALLPNPRLATLPTEYAALMTAAKALAAAIGASKTALKSMIETPVFPGPTFPAQVLAKTAGSRALSGAIEGQRAQLAALKAKRPALVQEAGQLGLVNYGQDPGDEAVFGA